MDCTNPDHQLLRNSAHLHSFPRMKRTDPSEEFGPIVSFATRFRLDAASHIARKMACSNRLDVLLPDSAYSPHRASTDRRDLHECSVRYVAPYLEFEDLVSNVLALPIGEVAHALGLPTRALVLAERVFAFRAALTSDLCRPTALVPSILRHSNGVT